MSVTSSNNKRIAKNSILLYMRMVVVMCVNLYTVRVVLNALGVEDYGIFNVIAGVVTMLNSVSATLSSATQRFYSFSLGKREESKLNAIFSVSITIYFILAFLILLVGETIGVWFVNSQLTIPEDRMIAANWIFQFALLSFIFSIFQCPFSASIIAHEKMGIFAGVNLNECFLKLIVALSIACSPIDKLIFYGASQMLVPLLSLLIYITIASRTPGEYKYRIVRDRGLYKQLISFSGWNLFASLAGVGMNQVINILINVFFGPVANAARAVSMQINGAINSFSSCFIMALNPPMIKSYAEGNYTYLNKLFSASNKLIFYSILIIIVPLYVKMEDVIMFWLKSSDILTIRYCRLILLFMLIIVMNNPISIIMQATGKVKQYFVPVETATLLCPLACWGFFKFGYGSEYAFYSMIASAIIAHIVRLICLKKYYPSISIKEYLYGFVLPASVIAISSFALSYRVDGLFSIFLIQMLFMVIVSLLFVGIMVYAIGINTKERQMLNSLCLKYIKK